MRLKKHICYFLTFFLLVSNSGLAFNVHFCKGKISSVSSIFSKEEICNMPVKSNKACCAKLQKTHKKCCSDKEVNLKDNPEKIIVKTISFDLQYLFFIPYWQTVFLPVIVSISYFQENIYSCDANAPPLYLLYSQYTFYA